MKAPDDSDQLAIASNNAAEEGGWTDFGSGSSELGFLEGSKTEEHQSTGSRPKEQSSSSSSSSRRSKPRSLSMPKQQQQQQAHHQKHTAVGSEESFKHKDNQRISKYQKGRSQSHRRLEEKDEEASQRPQPHKSSSQNQIIESHRQHHRQSSLNQILSDLREETKEHTTVHEEQLHRNSRRHRSGSRHHRSTRGTSLPRKARTEKSPRRETMSAASNGSTPMKDFLSQQQKDGRRPRRRSHSPSRNTSTMAVSDHSLIMDENSNSRRDEDDHSRRRRSHSLSRKANQSSKAESTALDGRTSKPSHHESSSSSPRSSTRRAEDAEVPHTHTRSHSRSRRTTGRSLKKNSSLDSSEGESNPRQRRRRSHSLSRNRSSNHPESRHNRDVDASNKNRSASMRAGRRSVAVGLRTNSDRGILPETEASEGTSSPSNDKPSSSSSRRKAMGKASSSRAVRPRSVPRNNRRATMATAPRTPNPHGIFEVGDQASKDFTSSSSLTNHSAKTEGSDLTPPLSNKQRVSTFKSPIRRNRPSKLPRSESGGTKTTADSTKAGDSTSLRSIPLDVETEESPTPPAEATSSRAGSRKSNRLQQSLRKSTATPKSKKQARPSWLARRLDTQDEIMNLAKEYESSSSFHKRGDGLVSPLSSAELHAPSDGSFQPASENGGRQVMTQSDFEALMHQKRHITQYAAAPKPQEVAPTKSGNALANPAKLLVGAVEQAGKALRDPKQAAKNMHGITKELAKETVECIKDPKKAVTGAAKAVGDTWGGVMGKRNSYDEAAKAYNNRTSDRLKSSLMERVGTYS